MLRFLIQSIPFNAELNSLQDGTFSFAVSFLSVWPEGGCIISLHPVCQLYNLYWVSKKKVNEFGEEYLNNEPSELAQIWNLDSGDSVHQNLSLIHI